MDVEDKKVLMEIRNDLRAINRALAFFGGVVGVVLVIAYRKGFFTGALW